MKNNIQTMADHWLKLLIYSVFVLNIKVHGASQVNLTILDSAVSKGAVCLDGSPPMYAYEKGSGDGANNWLIYVEGGAWCLSKDNCLLRSQGMMGSSRKRSNNPYFTGIIDGDQTFNPDFYNWNRIYLPYCDGASFMADVEGVDPETNLTFRGARIFDVVMEELLNMGMKNAENAILSGTSAGGLTTILHCDKFRGLLPNARRVKCISDSGFFIHGKDLPGAKGREDRFADVINTHKLAERLPASCTSKMDPKLCLFAENLIGDVQTPLFLVETSFDRWQIEKNFVAFLGDEAAQLWSNNCTRNVTRCTSAQFRTMQDFQKVYLNTIQKAVDKSANRGLFVNTCLLHGHLSNRDGMCSSVVGNVLQGDTIRKAIGEWYFDRSPFQAIDFKNNLPRNCSYLTWDEATDTCLKTNACGSKSNHDS
ncbi:hypothetical protein ABFS83_01G045400 [Erythranthe nasuta]